MAHISVVCPRCGSRYQLDPNLGGKQMRCPNTVCRAIFEVRDETATPAAPPPAPKIEAPPPRVSQVAGTVGDIVPILRAEQVEAPCPPASSPLPPPPVRARAGFAPSEQRENLAAAEELLPEAAVAELESPPSATETGDLPEGLHELGPGAWDAPPVRALAEAAPEPDGFAQQVPLAPPGFLREGPARERVRARRRSRWLMVALVLLLAGGLGGAAWAFFGRRAGDEAGRLERAEKLYADSEFAEAARLLQNLQRDFPDSSNLKLYRFLAELADVRDPIYQAQGDAEEAYKSLGRVMQFLQVYQKDALLKPRETDLWSTLNRIARELTEAAARGQERRLVDRARLALTEMSKFPPPSGTNAKDAIMQLERMLIQVDGAIASRERRQRVLDELKGLAANGWAETVRQARALVARAELSNDAEAQALLQDAVKRHIAGVTYTSVVKNMAPPSEDESEPSVLLAFERGKGTPASGANGTIFALARGVLYGLDARAGAVRWGRRVGADARVLPLRLPASAVAPEAVVVVAPDRQTVAAHAAESGAVIWRHALSGPCVAPPLRVGAHLLVPTLAGQVEEIELTGGKLLGYYELGQPLTVGGVHQEGTALVYFAADDFCVYILDVAKKNCAGVLYTGHASGSLRTPPLITYDGSQAKEKASGAGDRLLLLEATGLREVTFKAFALPIAEPDQKALEPAMLVRGRIDFPPWHDAERLAVATERGSLEVYGQKTQRGTGLPLFRLFTAELGVDAAGQETPAALLAHADAENFWVLCGRRLHRLQTAFSRENGPKLTPRWPVPPLVGSPLHAAQVLDSDTGHAVLFLATQERSGPTCMVQAIDGATGKRHWQRQLGVVCEQAVAFGEQVLARDRHGLFLFDPKNLSAGVSQAWLRPTAARTALAGQNSTFLSNQSDGYLATWSRDRSVPVLHLHHVSKVEPAVRTSPALSLPARLAGPPALGKDALVAALDNGLFVHVSLAEREVTPGPNWPAAAIEDPGPRPVVFLGGADFLATDGHRGMKVYHWPTANQVFPLARAEYKLPQRIAATPVVLPEARSEPPYRVAVADAGGTLHLLQGPPWTTVRAWPLGTQITAGPVVLGKHLACVVDQRRIVWLDPAGDEPVWEYSVGADVVGVPQLIDQTVVLASVAGQFLGLDAATGRPRGLGYTLRANVAPAVAPVPLGADRLFAPLSDGTVLLLSLKQLQ